MIKARTYNVIIWGSTFQVHLEPLIVQQKRIIRIIARAGFLEHTNSLFHRLKLLKFDDIYKYFVSIIMYKRIKNNFYQQDHRVNTRNRFVIQPPYQRLTITQHSFEYCGPKVWNELPPSIQNLPNINIFKRKLKLHFIDQYT